MATIVTCYFKLNKSKAPHENYLIWMSNMLSNNNSMIIFCDAASKSTIEEMRCFHKEKTLIVETEFSDFYCYQYSRQFVEHTVLDTELDRGHNMFLYMIWNEKTNFLKRAIELNPFKTDYFLWTDIGCFRETNTEYLNWPNPKRISEMPKDKVLLLSIAHFTEYELLTSSFDEIPSFQYENRISAPIFGGYKDVLLKWHKKYYEMLEYFILREQFIGKDQSIMNCVYLLNRDMCDLVFWKRDCKNPWFYLQAYLK